MKSKVLKIGTVLLACVCLISFMSIPVSALGTSLNDLNVISCDSFESDSSSFQGIGLSSSISTQFNSSIYGLLYDDGGPFAEYIYLQEGIETVFKFQFSKTGVYSFDIAFEKISIYSVSNAEVITMGNRTIDNKTFGTSRIKIEISQANTDIYLQLNGEVISEHQTDGSLGVYFYNISCAEDNTQNLIDNQNKNASDIMANQNANTQAQIDADKENTEQITNGWQGADGVDDGTTDDLKNAESAALGGKSDEQIEDEINNALTFDIWSFGARNITRIKQLFTNVYNVFGSNYQSLFLLSLTLGLAAFLIGRRYG